ncbi:MAG: DUF1800 domain-containing protein [Pyrinomonadaceae bacterium]
MKRSTPFLQKLAAIATIFTVLAPAGALRADTKSAAKPLKEEQKILHLLNRLGFGARPGDVERVKAIGLQKYIDQQLNPSSINDAVAESKVRNMDIFNMSTAELFEKYPTGAALLRQLEGGRAAQANAQAQKSSGTPNGTAEQSAEDAEKMTQAEHQQRRQKIADLLQKYDLKPAAQLRPQIVRHRVLRAVYSERQLQEVMVDFWQNHFNVFAGKAAVRWYIPSYERDVIRKHALGNFRDLVVGTGQHPAMLFYLDNFQSVAPNANAAANANADRTEKMIKEGKPLPPQARERLKRQLRLNDEQLDKRLKEMRANNTPLVQAGRGRGINENYARELMELHTLGVDGGYTQKDIIEVAKAFTGWTIADPQGYRRAAAAMIRGTEDRRLNRIQRQQGLGADLDSGEFYFNANWHDTSPKTALGQKINEGGIKDGLKVMDILVNHPSTAKHIARKLAVKFVTDKPSDGLVERIADAFTKSKGDIKTTLRALFSDKEFFAPENYRAKIKSPFELAVSAVRTLGADTNVSPAFIAMLDKLGEAPYGYPAPTGYPDTAEDWVNTGALLERLNFAVAISSNRIPGTRVDLKAYALGDKNKILDRAIGEILDGEISAATRANLAKQMSQPLPEVKAGAQAPEETMAADNMRPGQPGGGNRQASLLNPSGNPDVFKAVSLVLGTPEFQRQ